MWFRRAAATLLPFAVLIATAGSEAAQPHRWPSPTPPEIPGSDGYVEIPGVAIPRDRARTYKALFDATKGPEDPTKPLEAVLRAARQLNGLMAAHVPLDHVSFMFIVHKEATDALYTNAAYQRKHHIDNPNIGLVRQLKKAGVRFLVCGQYLAHADIPRSDLMPEAEVAESATLVIISLSNDGYAVLSN